MTVMFSERRPDDVQVFSFNGFQLRGLLVEDEPMFFAKDVSDALGYAETEKLTRRLDDDEKLHTNRGGIQLKVEGLPRAGVMLISESGLYSAILWSHKPEAKAFKKWVTSEVLPAIRKTGSYETPKSLEERSLALIGELSTVVQQQKLELEAARPKVATYDLVLDEANTWGVRELTKAVREHYPVNEADVKRLLREHGLLFRGSLVATAKAVDGGWAVQRAKGKFGGRERFQPRFTTKTLEWLLGELEPLGDVA